MTFQMIAFLADVHSGQLRVIRVVDFVLFALLFPRAVAGLIVHYREVVPQFVAAGRWSVQTDLSVGICLFSIGLFKKACLADSVAAFVPAAFDPPRWLQPVGLVTAWVGLLTYTFQLYFDFSG
jgi:alginate O-acetyltransferase complex protein AlgI